MASSFLPQPGPSSTRPSSPRVGTRARRATGPNLTLTLEANKARLGGRLPEAQVWLSLKSKAISRPARAFLWKCLHGVHRVGSYWSHIPGFDEQANGMSGASEGNPSQEKDRSPTLLPGPCHGLRSQGRLPVPRGPSCRLGGWFPKAVYNGRRGEGQMPGSCTTDAGSKTGSCYSKDLRVYHLSPVCFLTTALCTLMAHICLLVGDEIFIQGAPQRDIRIVVL